jgi:aspartate carbamoyltransferase catalytic subunit
MGVNAFVIRHQEESLFQDLLNAGISAHLINAGCGAWAHPTQALIDLAVIAARHPDLSQLTVAIVGDVKHSRVARSQMRLFSKMGVGEIRVISPASLAMDDAPAGVIFEEDIKKGLVGAQVIICLRLQEERFAQQFELDKSAYVQRYCLTPELLAYADPQAIVLHPGPCMIGTDMTQSVIESPQSMLLKQVQQAVPLRMAVMDYVFGQL